VHHGNGLVGQRLAGIEGSHLGVVPLGNLAHEHFGQHRAAHAQLAGLEALKVEHRHGAANDGRELDHAVLIEILALDRRIGGTESDGLGTDLANAARRADRLVVQTDARFLLVRLGPFAVNRKREGSARAGDVGGDGGAHGGRGQCSGGNGLQKGTLGVHSGPHGW